MNQVIIIGAGLAGCASSIALSKRGYNTLILDRNSVDNMTKLPETLYPAALEILQDMDVDTSDTLNSEVDFVSQDNTFSLTLSLKNKVNTCPFIDRNILDRKLRTKVIASGAHKIEQKTIQSVMRYKSNFLVTATDGATFTAPFLIDASGKAQIAAELVGGISHDDRQLDLRQNIFAHFENENGFNLKRLTIINAVTGFFYVVPIHKNRMALGWVTYFSLTEENFETTFQKAIERTPATKQFIDAAKQITPVIMAKNHSNHVIRAASNGALITGDALGFYDPFFRDGIGFSLASGRLAGNCCADLIEKNNSFLDIEQKYATENEEINQNFCKKTTSSLEKIRNLYSSSQILDPHIPASIAAVLTGLTSDTPGTTDSIIKMKRSFAHEAVL